MKHITATYSLLTLALMGATNSYAGPAADSWTGNWGVYLGNKSLDHQEWQNHEKHSSVALLTDFKKSEWPVSVAVDLFGTGDEDSTASGQSDAYSAEAHIGFRKILAFDEPSCHLRPYVGGGLALVFSELTQPSGSASSTDEDTGKGYWLGTGAYYDVSDSFSVGLDLRYSSADIRLHGVDHDAGGTNMSVGAVYRW